MDASDGPPKDACYTTFIENTSRGQTHFAIDFNGTSIDLAMYAKIPHGTGAALTYGAYDPAVGLAPGQVAIVFLGYSPVGGLQPNVACPVPGTSFRPVWMSPIACWLVATAPWRLLIACRD